MTLLPFLALRDPGYAFLNGKGIEIGPFEHPAKLPPSCEVEYCDAITPEQARVFFPELSVIDLPHIHHIIDLNKEGLVKFPNDSLDFVICNHVIEHLVDPIRILGELMRVVRPGGHVVIAAPDKEYTFDKKRPLTPWEHNVSDYEMRATDSSPEDYMDILTYIHPEHLGLPKEEILRHLMRLKDRREHLHVWDSGTFRAFLTKSFELLKLDAFPIYEVDAYRSKIEYFGVWVKGGDEERRRFEAMQITPPKPALKSWLVNRMQHHYRKDGIAGVLKAIGRKFSAEKGTGNTK